MYRRNRKWYSGFWYEGKRYTKGWGAISKSIAKEKERKFRNEIASGMYERRNEKIEFESFVVRFLKEKRITTKTRVYKYYIDYTKPLVRFFLAKELVVIKGEREDEKKFQSTPYESYRLIGYQHWYEKKGDTRFREGQSKFERYVSHTC